MEPNIHVIALLAVASRIADVWTTYLASPRLRLESNALARKFGWPYALLTILAGLMTYQWKPIGIVIFAASFLAAAFNASKLLMAQALGEEEMVALSRRVFLATRAWPGMLYSMLPGIFTGILGAFLAFFSKPLEISYFFGIGVVTFAMAFLVWYPLRYFRAWLDTKRAA